VLTGLKGHVCGPCPEPARTWIERHRLLQSLERTAGDARPLGRLGADEVQLVEVGQPLKPHAALREQLGAAAQEGLGLGAVVQRVEVRRAEDDLCVVGRPGELVLPGGRRGGPGIVAVDDPIDPGDRRRADRQARPAADEPQHVAQVRRADGRVLETGAPVVAEQPKARLQVVRGGREVRLELRRLLESAEALADGLDVAGVGMVHRCGG